MFNRRDNRDFFISEKIEVKKTENMGLGVFAKEKILKGTVVESCHVIIFNRNIFKDFKRTYETDHMLKDYVFYWKNAEAAVALGYGSIYNHSNDPNAMWRPSFAFSSERRDPPRIHFTAIKDIEAGEQIFTHYNVNAGDLFFAEDGTFHPDRPIDPSEASNWRIY